MERRVIFPWEGRRSFRRLRLARLRGAALLGLVLLLLGWLIVVEREDGGKRLTRARIEVLRGAVERFLAKNEGKCPPNLAAAASAVGLPTPLLDAWGQPLLFQCPGVTEWQAFELMSGGPDRSPGGLDRIE